MAQRRESETPRPIAAWVRRLGRQLRMRRAFLRARDHGRWTLAVAFILASLRPWLIPLSSDVPPFWGAVLAAALFVVATLVGFTALWLSAFLHAMSPLGAAQEADRRLGDRELVANGWSFETAERDDPMARLARSRAEKLVATQRTDALLPSFSLAPRRRTALLALLAFLGASAVGIYRPGLVDALTVPPTASEQHAASELERALSDLERTNPRETRRAKAPSSPQGDSSAGSRSTPAEEQARRAVNAARRGDREAALRHLDTLRHEGAQSGRRARQLERALASLREELQRGAAGSSTRKRVELDAASESRGASEELSLLAKRTQAPRAQAAAEAEHRRTLERLSRWAADEQTGDKELSRALSRAAEAFSAQDRHAAAQALEAAARRAASLEAERLEAMRRALTLERLEGTIGPLERAMLLTRLGKTGTESEPLSEGARSGDEPGNTRAFAMDPDDASTPDAGAGPDSMSRLRMGLAARLAALGLSTGAPGGGAAGGARAPRNASDGARARHSSLRAEGTVHAPSLVAEGGRAVLALQGLGAKAEPSQAYQEIFPTYDAIVEEALGDETVPAFRRGAVRRYFELIRPDGSAKGSER